MSASGIHSLLCCFCHGFREKLLVTFFVQCGVLINVSYFPPLPAQL